MVRYYGRAKTRVGSVNTNQLGLKMSGCPSKIGKSNTLVRYQNRHAKCNLLIKGPVSYHGVIWKYNSGKNTVPRQSKCSATAGGVGRINTPRFDCPTRNKKIELTDSLLSIGETLFPPVGAPIPMNYVLFSKEWDNNNASCKNVVIGGGCCNDDNNLEGPCILCCEYVCKHNCIGLLKNPNGLKDGSGNLVPSVALAYRCNDCK